MAPGSGCQLNSGRVSEMDSPKGPNRANPVLAPGASEWGGARLRDPVASVGSCNGGVARVSDAAGAGSAAGEAGAGRAAGATDVLDPADATGDCATGTAAEVLLSHGLPRSHQKIAAPAITTIVATDTT